MSSQNESHQSERGKDLGHRAAGAARWSILTTVVSKLVSPVTTMVLARLLTPEAFGIIASATMVTSLADLFSDAGFQKYLIQHGFPTLDDMRKSASVAFWTNMCISVLIVVFVAIFNEPIAVAVGNPGMGFVLIIASLSLPLTALVSVQTALYQREFNFRMLFKTSVGSSLLIFALAVPLAALGFSYWSMIIATVASYLMQAIWLTARSPWKPTLFYSFTLLKEMFSYGVWILMESLFTWVNNWAGTLIIGNVLSSYDVGLYKTSTNLCAAVISIITGAIIPVAFSSFSAVQDDKERLDNVFYLMQRYLALGCVPLAVGVFVFRRLATFLALGSQWMDTAFFLGFWMLSGCITVVMSYLCSEVYRAKGCPKAGVIVQGLYLIPYLPALYFSALNGYAAISVVMPLVRLCLPLINGTVYYFFEGVSLLDQIKNTKWVYFWALVAAAPGILITCLTDNLLAAAVGAVLMVLVYAVAVFKSKHLKDDTVGLLNKLGLGKIAAKFA